MVVVGTGLAWVGAAVGLGPEVVGPEAVVPVGLGALGPVGLGPL